MKKLSTFLIDSVPFIDGDKLPKHAPIGLTQMISTGFVPPDPQDSDLFAVPINTGQHRIMMYRVETKSVPKSALDELVDQMVAGVLERTGRKVGRKERKILAEEALLELLPRAFPKAVEFPVWVENLPDGSGHLHICTTNQNHIDVVITDLVRAFDGMVIKPIVCEKSPQRLMTELLMALNDGYGDTAFQVLDECQLQSQDEDKATVTYQRHQLGEAERHIAEGKLPVCLSLQYKDRVTFRLHDNGAIDRIELLDNVMAERSDEEGGFAGDWIIYTAELSALFEELVSCMGSEKQDDDLGR